MDIDAVTDCAVQVTALTIDVIKFPIKEKIIVKVLPIVAKNSNMESPLNLSEAAYSLAGLRYQQLVQKIRRKRRRL